ncbi:GPW/gp25 family protein [Pararhizobium sp. A13]|uniref:GPW/gp25 family protein n=1 Tax=Pararhizobium sp. A13 TaxID=3133975 RepID=UPI00311B111C
MNRDFLGRGWSFPPDFTRVAAGVAMLEEDADVASSLEILLSTTPGERVLQPLYGCNLSELLFETLDARMKTLMADKVESAILYYESRVKLERVQLDDSLELEGVVRIELVYRIKSTNSRFNFVYPFYKNEGTDINLTTIVNLIPDSD